MHAPLWGPGPLRGGLKSSSCTITVFEVFRYLVQRTFSSQDLDMSCRNLPTDRAAIAEKNGVPGESALADLRFM